MIQINVGLPALHDEEAIYVLTLTGEHPDALRAIVLVSEPDSTAKSPRSRVRTIPVDEIVFQSGMVNLGDLAAERLAEQMSEAHEDEVPGAPVPSRLS